MKVRRSRLKSVLKQQFNNRDDKHDDNEEGVEEMAPTLSSFFTLGVGSHFIKPPSSLDEDHDDETYLLPGGPVAQSDTIPDACINSHPRFRTLTENIRSRRGSKVYIYISIRCIHNARYE
jgi:hypothetical protein